MGEMSMDVKKKPLVKSQKLENVSSIHIALRKSPVLVANPFLRVS
ncbi:predicted protein [Sclerotinia sclerotiorum 1980 UF-70]|uniref:Uncharacterized protein n=1 Tax=Sclerotinia sclerotiorum (strain ATCC 18683 / 1980 / Ss-1) TaxID=665079 RepID=A7F469_SCLS1|nr:predicted protein [Sclerotinia sclerotiorum 1980 UF-70]EDN97540.1 predicted protein [Sclerotinia sclerotiorum 1980 UF-70]